MQVQLGQCWTALEVQIIIAERVLHLDRLTELVAVVERGVLRESTEVVLDEVAELVLVVRELSKAARA